jgi:N-acetylglucosamine malate deacetylase 1
MNKKIIVIAPHPDDETLGVGGTLLRHKMEGDEIAWLIMTNISTKEGWGRERVNIRQSEIEKVSNKYNFDATYKLDFPTTRLDQIPISIMVESVSKVILSFQPDTVYLPNRSDIHSDHRITFNVAMACTKTFRFPSISRILMYETISETEFIPAISEGQFTPNTFVDISDYMEKKIDIMKVYSSEMMDYPQPRSVTTIQSLARVRGSRISKQAAEAFQLIFDCS